MRLNQDQLEEITKRRQPAAQARWFKAHFGVAPPCDGSGVIITQAAFEGLVAKKCGLSANGEARPSVRLLRELD
jgi:hypothetical protein